jgi:SAM-dependent methyltransferase
MNLLDLIHRTTPPLPWSEGDKIPWNDPDFSTRMLQEHLSQEHDAASRRFEKIDAHVDWIHRALLSGHPTPILDLGCGPGLYCSRLARLGHECVGIDFAPASIGYAMRTAQEEGLRCTYLHQDIRTADYGTGFGLAMLIYGEFNTFRPSDARHILRKAHDALSGGGILLLEPSTFAAVQAEGERGPSWTAEASGLFADRPHLCLTENFWDPERRTTTTRFFIVDAATGDVTRHASSSQAYTDGQLAALLAECGFAEITFYPSLTGTVDETQSDFFALVARKWATL